MPKWTDMQAKALESTGNLLISASAGSGKTSVMVQKIENYLLFHEGADISRLVAITFTKASAEEMKQKLADNLYKKLRNTTDDALRARIRQQINGIPLSNMSTIDSYCSQIYLRYFETINKDPAVSIIEPGEAAYMFASAREEVLESYLQNSDEDFSMLIDKFIANRDIDRLRKAIDDIQRFLAVQSDPKDFVDRALSLAEADVASSATINYILSYHRKRASRMAAQCQAKYDILSLFNCTNKVFIDTQKALLDIRDSLYDIANAKDIANLFFISEHTTSIGTPVLRKITKVNDMEREALADAIIVIKSTKDFIKEVKERFDNGYDAAISAEVDSRKAANKLFEVALAVITKYHQAKDKEKLLDFADLEHYALQILSNAAVAAEVKDSIDCIFIDEYQDTNYLQESILSKISDGNVFMVGDVKQSIYKFRYAEPAIFLDKRERYMPGKDGTNINFNENFRSSQAVLDFINLIFDEIMVYDLGEIDYRKDARLKYGLEHQIKKQNTLPDADITLFGKNNPPVQEYPQYYSVITGPRCMPAVSSEAIYIAQRITEIVGKMYIYDATQEAYRLCKYQDIALLFRTRSSAKNIIAQLQMCGIPFIAEGFSQTSDNSIVDTLVCFAKVLDNPKQDIPLAAVMLSYFGKFCDKELLEIRASCSKGYFWEAIAAYSGNPTIETKIKDLFQLLDTYRNLSTFIDVRELLDRLIAATGYDGYALSLGGNHIQILNAFVFSLSGKSSATIKSFLDAYATMGQDSLPPSGADDCVTLTTIHKSKGLEYPIVFLPCVEYYQRNTGGGKIVLEDNTGVQLRKEKLLMGTDMVALDTKLGISIVHIDEGRTYSTLSSMALALKKDLDNKAELIRLFYVAATRARQHLFISGTKGKDSKSFSSVDEAKSFLDLIYYALGNNPKLSKYFAQSPDVIAQPVSDTGSHYIPQETTPINVTLNYPFAASTNLSYKYSVSTLARQAAEDSAAPIARQLDFDNVALSYDNASDTTSEAASKTSNNIFASNFSSNNMLLGTAYHAIMQHADFSKSTPAEVDAQIDNLLASGIIDQLPQGFNRTVMHKAFANPRLVSLSAAKTYREQPFMLHISANMVTETASTDTVLVQGVIDFLSVGSQIVLVDYKYTFADAATIRNRYRKQLDIYKLAVQHALGIKVDSCEVFVINRNEFVTI